MIGKPVNFKSSGGSDFIINDRGTYPNMWNAAPFYYIKLESADGLFGADVSTEAFPIPNIAGEKSGDAFRRGKGIALSGVIEARNLSALYDGVDFLQHMFAELAVRKLIFQRYNDSFQIYVNCRVTQDLSVTETVPDNTQNALRWGWVVGLRADIPFSYKVSDDSLFPTWQV